MVLQDFLDGPQEGETVKANIGMWDSLGFFSWQNGDKMSPNKSNWGEKWFISAHSLEASRQELKQQEFEALSYIMSNVITLLIKKNIHFIIVTA